ncbi:hypothetical protein PoB_005483800 [Plakobranchus ocellatus]|uniref:Uncharacterized protein n=1 Tax=Plakobranchus ocellatus TaxID=259542 RepID=A0AAV4CBF4_9GAST|nr:hypothetical protein PoB_005483800 [Plakobranchus ocellatus]
MMLLYVNIVQSTLEHAEPSASGGIGGTLDTEAGPISAKILLWRVRAPPLAPWPDVWPESLRSPCGGLAKHRN